MGRARHSPGRSVASSSLAAGCVWVVLVGSLLTVGCDGDGPAPDPDQTGTDTERPVDLADGTEDTDASTASDADPLDDAPKDVSQDLDQADGDAIDSTSVPWTDGRCNGAEALCDRRYHEVAYATSHNAFATEAEGFTAPNHRLAMAEQLELGIRGLMLDVYLEGSTVWLCHSVCVIGRRTLLDGLRDLDAFLDANPGEVVTLILESYVDPDDLEPVFESAGLTERLVALPADPAVWPTLREMVESDRRVVVLSDRDGGSRPWLHDIWSVAFETHWDNQSVDDFECTPNRGSSAHPLFVLNHFLSDPLPDPALAEQVNYNPYLVERARACGEAHDRLSNFVTVDFVGIGDVVAATRLLNGL